MDTLLQRLPTDLGNIVTSIGADLGRALTSPNADDIEWLISVRRSFCATYAAERVCTVECYSISMDQDFGVDNDSVRASDVLTGGYDVDGDVFCSVDESYHLEKDVLIERLTGVAHMGTHVNVGYEINFGDESVDSDTTLLDVKSIFMIAKSKAKLQRLDNPILAARTSTLSYLRQIAGQYAGHKAVLEMYLSTSILNAELDVKIERENGVLTEELLARISRRCDLYYTALVDAVGCMC